MSSKPNMQAAPPSKKGPENSNIDDWELPVVKGMINHCLSDHTGTSTINQLRDFLIEYYPQVLPFLKQKYSKFTNFLARHSNYFQINTYDRSVRLVAVHPTLTKKTVISDTNSASNPTSQPKSQLSIPSQQHINHINTNHAANNSNHVNNNSNHVNNNNNQQDNSNSSPQIMVITPRGGKPLNAYLNNPTDFSGPSSKPIVHQTNTNTGSTTSGNSGVGGGTTASQHQYSQRRGSASAPQHNTSNSHTQPQNASKRVAFSSLEIWEQIAVFTALKYLLQVKSEEHFSVLQERINEPLIFTKYQSLRELLCLFPGIFVVDNAGLVSLHDPVKAKAQYPVLAVEFENRISRPNSTNTQPQNIPASTSSTFLQQQQQLQQLQQQQLQQQQQAETAPIMNAINSASTLWEKALIKSVYLILLNQPNHAANFPWLTTFLTKYKPHVKEVYGSLRLWAIQQDVFKFHGDTIYIPVTVAPVPRAPPPPPPPMLSRLTSGNSTYASVASANFSIPVPPALPQRRNPIVPSSSLPSKQQGTLAGPSTSSTQLSISPSVTSLDIRSNNPLDLRLNNPLDIRSNNLGMTSIDDSFYRGRTQTTQQRHKRQRSASPSSLRQLRNQDNLSVPDKYGHMRSNSTTMNGTEIDSVIANASNKPKRTSTPNTINPQPTTSNNNTTTSIKVDARPSSGMNTNVQLPSRKHASLDNGKPSYLQTIQESGKIPSINSGTSTYTTSRETSQNSLGDMPTQHSNRTDPLVSPRRPGNASQLMQLDKDIPSILNSNLMVNGTMTNIKLVSNMEELKKMISFISNYSSIAISAEFSTTKPKEEMRSTRTSSVGIDIRAPRNATTEMNASSPSSTQESVSPSIHTGTISPSHKSDEHLFVGSAPDVLGVGSSPLLYQTNHDEAGISNAKDDMNIGNNASTTSKKRRRHSFAPSPRNKKFVESGSEDSASNVISLLCITTRLGVNSPPSQSQSSSAPNPASLLFAQSEKDGSYSRSYHPIFVVDMLNNPNFKRPLKSILQTNSILKVVYQCPALSEVLYSTYGIHLKNIVDIQVLHRLVWEVASLPSRLAASIDSSVDDVKSPGVSPSNESTLSSESRSIKGPFSSHSLLQEIMVPPVDSTLGYLLSYYDIQFSGIRCLSSHQLYEATKMSEYNDDDDDDDNPGSNMKDSPSIKAPNWEHRPLDIATASLAAASVATLLDIRLILLAQMNKVISKTTSSLSQTYSHTNILDFHISELGSRRQPNQPPQQDWIDAPEMFSHLSM